MNLHCHRQSVETVAFEGIILMSGHLADPITDVAAMGITFTLIGQAYAVVSGVAGANHPMHQALALIPCPCPCSFVHLL